LDERLDRDLLREVAKNHPEWHFVLIGPVVKIREQDLPKAANIHYLGQKAYTELPRYLSGWNVTMLPFAMNASTRFISPTKTPEYLAAGKPVVSTPIQDVVRPYGELGLAEIAGDALSFGEAVEKCLEIDIDKHIDRADRFLSDKSWDRTFREMWKEVQRCGKDDNEDTDFAKPEKVRKQCSIT
jgi:glycosyltransferase involved in cell wall biosynthesis